MQFKLNKIEPANLFNKVMIQNKLKKLYIHNFKKTTGLILKYK